jgi:MFS family permease
MKSQSKAGGYYGWMIVLLAAVAMAGTLPGRTHGLGLITKRLLDDFPSISQADFGVINFWATILGALFCLPCGWLADRVGLRQVVGGVTLALAGTVAWMSMLEDRMSLLVAITLSRGIGQSMLSVISITMVGKWFQRRMGVAMGTYAVLMSLMMAVGTGVVGYRVSQLGWRHAWLEVAYGLFAITPLLWLLTRNQPADRTIEFSGDEAAIEPRIVEASCATWQQALATPCFWVFAGSISLFGLVSSGVSLFQQFIMAERGLNETVFQTCLVIGLLTGMVANLAVGGLARKLPLQALLAVAMLLFATATAVLALVRSPAEAYACAVVNGAAGGSITVLFFAVWGHAYGPAQLGRIQSLAQMMTVFASALGPLVVAKSQAGTGSYRFILTSFAISAAVLAVIAWFTPVPNAAAGFWQSNSGETIPLIDSEPAA